MTPDLDHQFSLARYWERGDAISHAIAYLLLAMSLVSWFFILAKSYAAWRTRRSAPAVQAFWDAPTMADGVAALTLADPELIYAPLAQQGAARLAGHAGAAARASLSGTLGHGEQVTRLLRVA